LFKEVVEKMRCDPCMMIEGSTCHGMFTRTSIQTLNIDDSVLFETSSNVSKIDFKGPSGDMTVREDGVYIMEFDVVSSKASQFSVFVNGVSNDTTTSGINAGANRLLLRQTLSLKSGDVVSVRNHISAIGTITISQNPGGITSGGSPSLGSNAIFVIYKVSPLAKDCFCCEEQKCEEKLLDFGGSWNKYDFNLSEQSVVNKWSKEETCLYEEFKWFLLNQDCLSPIGSDSYAVTFCMDAQDVAPETPIRFDFNGYLLNTDHVPSTSCIKVKKSGIYSLISNSTSDQPSQVSVFVNGTLVSPNTSGTDSGAGEVSLLSLICLKCGDVVTIVNHVSAFPNILLSQNPGGTEVGVNCKLLLYKITNRKKDDDRKK